MVSVLRRGGGLESSARSADSIFAFCALFIQKSEKNFPFLVQVGVYTQKNQFFFKRVFDILICIHKVFIF